MPWHPCFKVIYMNNEDDYLNFSWLWWFNIIMQNDFKIRLCLKCLIKRLDTLFLIAFYFFLKWSLRLIYSQGYMVLILYSRRRHIFSALPGCLVTAHHLKCIFSLFWLHCSIVLTFVIFGGDVFWWEVKNHQWYKSQIPNNFNSWLA